MTDRPTVDGPLTAEELEDRDAGWDKQFKLDTLPAPWPGVYTHSGCGNQYTGGQDF